MRNRGRLLLLPAQTLKNTEQIAYKIFVQNSKCRNSSLYNPPPPPGSQPNAGAHETAVALAGSLRPLLSRSPLPSLVPFVSLAPGCGGKGPRFWREAIPRSPRSRSRSPAGPLSGVAPGVRCVSPVPLVLPRTLKRRRLGHHRLRWDTNGGWNRYSSPNKPLSTKKRLGRGGQSCPQEGGRSKGGGGWGGCGGPPPPPPGRRP